VAEQTLYASFYVSLVAVGDRLLWGSKDLSACENHTRNYTGNYTGNY
jgi:hypothetical protein